MFKLDSNSKMASSIKLKWEVERKGEKKRARDIFLLKFKTLQIQNVFPQLIYLGNVCVDFMLWRLKCKQTSKLCSNANWRFKRSLHISLHSTFNFFMFVDSG